MDDYPQLALDRQLCLPLYAASRAVTRRYTELLAEVGLTYPQYLCLLALWDAGEPLSVGELGARLHLDSGTLTPLLKRMEAAGLVSRSRDESDERRVLVSVTDQGWALRPRVADVPLRLVQGMGLEQADGDALRSLLDHLLAELEH
ncbi:MarR family transcriptional regulator [Aeromicrobium sp. 636]|uniref:MarR family transcriptional regulator n=1 Tax=Aeromicrobium senzhongii TaxID=2663859 RepID=A0A8I0K0H9_9ACTN|nr:MULTISPECIES: MarR family transcriptional regulator [Aeromicrobium]MBC9226386.1 MarR family transcriptional regulator [Aeromicrobium senzhongii]MCQ3998491.1 MarR family transcriptional regulator [Aeromicrobium sp. 636]MTB88913.1 MarR family transcriptional regulator [Aeromicrobium senzhongii]QNL93804.1 MarR family transcriptional regulator [Aeromicrobium senzhongii]